MGTGGQIPALSSQTLGALVLLGRLVEARPVNKCFIVRHKNLFQTQKIYEGHMSSAEICERQVSFRDFGATQIKNTKNNDPF